jgi:tetratricopeptide (TPR) repeat protein
MSQRFLVVLSFLALAGCRGGGGQGPADSGATVPLYTDLGNHAYAITAARGAQAYFDQGLRLTYAFNHAEAIRAFREAARHDPGCAMCYWGVAYAYGPNINAAMDSASGVEAYAAVQLARQNAAETSELEQALIAALSERYAPGPPSDRAALDSAYARAMGEVRLGYPDDLEVATLYAEALMDLSPWNYWNPDGSPRPGTSEILGSLEGVIEQDPSHPGACHFYIHAVEAVQPERAVACAERLADLMPGAGHLVHMPAHIYIRVGRYLDAIEANEHAVHADETYIRDQRPVPGLYLIGYYPHNSDFLAFAATMAGRGGQALESARMVESLVPDEMIRAPGMSMLEHFATGSLRLMVRFGRWDEVLAAPEPAEDLRYARGTWHFARGMARAARGEMEAAESELAAVSAAASDPAMAEIIVGFNTASSVLAIARRVLAGEIAAGRGDLTGAIASLEEAARSEDALTYGEPPDWPVPVRHHLGAVLLEAGRAADAERVYREDLARFPENGWALFGLAQSLRAQGREVEATQVEQRFANAWAGSDVTLTAAGF